MWCDCSLAQSTDAARRLPVTVERFLCVACCCAMASPSTMADASCSTVGCRAAPVFTRLTDQMAGSQLPEIQTLRSTLMRWRFEILTYFASGLTNGRTEGFNNKAKVMKRRAYGYRSFANYRLRLLNACA